MKKKQLGFTLTEILIVVSIVAILAAIGVPSYQSSVRKTQRSTAQARMLEIAGLLENNHLQKGQYEKAFVDSINKSTDYNVSPDAKSKRYEIKVTLPGAAANAGGGQAFLITATAYNASQKKDACDVLTLDNFNVKGGKKGSTVVNDCW